MDEFVHWMENFKLSLISSFPPYSSSSHTLMTINHFLQILIQVKFLKKHYTKGTLVDNSLCF